MDKREFRSIKKRRRRRSKKTRQIMRIAVLAAMALICVLLIIGVVKLVGKLFDGKKDNDQEAMNQISIEEQKKQQYDATIAEAKYLFAAYDYDAAAELLKTIEGYEEETEITTLIQEIETEKASCVPVKMEEVTHIFYHSLVVDPQRAFANQDTDNQAVGNNQWMTTVSEFNKITQEMYDRGYVMVSIHDLINVVQDENGNTKYEPAEIMLPPDKKAFVLSLDDLSYYHAYDNYGYATKLLIDENGDVMNEYTDAQGNTTIGAYDVVPLMDQFVKEHPDASYRGAKGIIALTGYNGVLGYRTDITYDLNNPDCDIHQKKWIEAHPDFTLENERAEAKKVADAMKANGWEFASHTWGHLRVGDSSLARLQRDNEKWQSNVVPIVGETDCIIFAHGQDLQGRGDYDESNAKYQYFRNEGFTIFCNVDSNEYTTWFGPDYLRQGRRNLDGYRIYKNATGQQDNVSDLFDAAAIIDPERPPVPEL